MPQEQSSELCQLVEAIEKSSEGKEELARITKEGNQFKDGKGGKAGNFVKEIWLKIERVSSKTKGKTVSDKFVFK